MRTKTTVASIVLGALLLAACGGGSTTTAPPAPLQTGTQTGGIPKTPPPGGTASTSTQSPVKPQAPVPVESNPPGDIPDSIAFVPYRSKSGGFTITTPEGWSRTAKKDSVVFTDKLNTVRVTWSAAAKAPTVASANATEVPALKSSTLAFRLQGVKAASLPAGPAVFVTYQANSQPNSVTGKQYRQDVQRYELFHNGQEVVVTLLSPVGADNVDPWRIVTESLKWN